MSDRLQRIHTKETKMLKEIGTSTFPQIPKNGRQRKLTCSSREHLDFLKMYKNILTIVQPGEFCNKLEQSQGKTFDESLPP